MEKDILKQLYQKYRKEIYLYLYSLCKKESLAEDLLQETFLKALLSLPDDHTNKMCIRDSLYSTLIQTNLLICKFISFILQLYGEKSFLFCKQQFKKYPVPLPCGEL